MLAFDAAIVGWANDVITADAYVDATLLLVYVAATELYWAPLVNHDANVRFPPQLIAPPIPTPPVITKAPVPVVVDAVVFVKVTIPEAPNVVTPDNTPVPVKVKFPPTVTTLVEVSTLRISPPPLFFLTSNAYDCVLSIHKLELI